MTTSTWICDKAQTSPEKYIGSTVHMFDQLNTRGKTQPFNQAAGVSQYRGWVYAAAWMNAKAVSTTPLRMYVRRGPGESLIGSNGKRSMRSLPRQKRFMMGGLTHTPSPYVMRKAAEWGGEFEQVTEKTPLTALLEHPNPWMLGSIFSQMRSMMICLTGNFYMTPVVESLRYRSETLSRIKELWVMPSQYVKIQPDEADFIKGYWYGIDPTKAKFFPPDEVFHMTRPNPADLLYGLGDVEAGWSALGLSSAQRQTDMAHYANHSRPDLAVITKSMSGSSQNIGNLKELQEEWSRLFRGTFRAGSPVFLTGDTEVIPLNYQPTEIGDREIVVEEIAAIMGVPVTLLKANDPNLASARVGFASWREQTVLPYCRADEEYLNKYLLPAFGLEGDAFLCYDDPVPENRDEVQAMIATAMQYGTMTRNEIRVQQGENPVDDENADKLLVPTGLVPIEDVGKAPPGMGPFSFGGGDKGPKDDADADKKDDKSIVRQSATIYAKGHVDEREGEPEKLIRGMQLSIARVFAIQRRECQAIIAGKKSVNSGTLAKLLAAIYNTNGAMAEAISPYIEKILDAGGRAGLEQIKVDANTFVVTNPAIAEFMRNYSIRLAGEINQYTAERLSETLAEGMDTGESAGMLSQRVGALYSDFDGYRTEMIARTESARAFCRGSEQAWKESDVVAGKTWELASGGCPICSAIAAKFGDNPIPLDEAFYPLGSVIPIGGGKTYSVDYAPIYGPPSHPNCRCGVRAVMKGKS